MIRHLLRLIWNRKRTNLLLMIELFFSFLVLFVVVTLGVFYVDNYRRPLGFRFDDVWCITVNTNMPGPAMDMKDAGLAATSLGVFRAVQELPEVEAVASAFATAFDEGGWSTAYRVDGRPYAYDLNRVSDGFRDVMGLELVSGRWLSREDDDSSAVKNVVINEWLARDFFGSLDAVGRLVPQDKDSGGHERTPERVVGVVRDFRQRGEYSAPGGYMFRRHQIEDRLAAPARILLVKLRPGTSAAFEERLMKALQGAARDWSFKVESLTEKRAFNHQLRLAPVLLIALVSCFLLLMVALGLTGVLWQNVTQRTREIGLRRAKGATAARIHRQVLGEVAVMTSLALAAGVLVVVQFPLLDVMGFVRPGVFATSLAVSAAAIYVLTMVCGFYPGRLATRLSPAEALHYE